MKDAKSIIHKFGGNGLKYEYKPTGVCSQKIEFEVDDGIIKDVRFFGGCNGNLKGISSIVKGMKVQDVIDRLKGINCGMKKTSCPDQLARALEQALQSGEGK